MGCHGNFALGDKISRKIAGQIGPDYISPSRISVHVQREPHPLQRVVKSVARTKKVPKLTKIGTIAKFPQSLTSIVLHVPSGKQQLVCEPEEERHSHLNVEEATFNTMQLLIFTHHFDLGLSHDQT